MVDVPLNAEKRAFVVEHYFRTSSYKRVRELFIAKFGEGNVPNKSTIQRLVKNFQTRYTLDSRKKARRSSVLTSEKIDDIRSRISRRPATSVRKLALQSNIHRSSAFRALKKLKLRAYRAMLVQELLPPDPPRRLEFCKWFQKFIRKTGKGAAVLDNVFFSDEAWFHKTGYINASNYRFWCSENPHVYRESSLHPEKIGVWCAISRRRIIGPIFFSSTVTTIYCIVRTRRTGLLAATRRRACALSQ